MNSQLTHFKFVLVFVLALLARLSLADNGAKGGKARPSALESLESPRAEQDSAPEKAGAARYLASGNKDEDVAHYHGLARRLGVDIGMMVPQGDFQKEFGMAPAVGLHFMWEAIPPFSFVVSTNRASSNHKNGAASGKLTVSSINIGTQASFPVGRFMPFIKMEGAFHFNDVSFDASRVVTAGNDTFVTTVGLNAGIGWDFVVGREVSFGLQGTYHYAVPKKVTLSNGATFDMGSSYLDVSFRVNF
jgi:hypothetical protein